MDWIKVKVNFKAINDTDKRLKVGGLLVCPEAGECYGKVKPYWSLTMLAVADYAMAPDHYRNSSL
ncbi:hypothetical protein PF005_g15600 [Phytophthora fragariae]|uniref:Uncharacterized protein n=1 Tax=Phytophthora fragariae TaxID=53985 RepID=A0A6A4D2A3_9STRA|nr:hypothetical protein PF003_g5338 [Phytophthora fragariae]KAE8933273.1 hypothetical protein PF009_g16717 [Phytophthora fragariae]KAE9002865.1 hypothetical protein PF011_g13134 [Phytophthora fragariae]KAE9099364.1 hypothetical protein PF010_g15226 [Phytophthora fragariae]KAE9102392.1 hypothetical protein PF007_g14778 [Phytophthora fragariae]